MLGGHHLIPRKGAGFWGVDQNIFFYYDPAGIYVFPAAWSSNYLFHFHFWMDFCFLKAVIYFNSWQLQIIYFTIFLL